MVGAAWLAQQVSRHPTKDHLLAAPTYKVLQQSTLKKFFSEFGWYRQFYNESKNVIALPTGGNVYIRSTDDPFGLEGMTVASAWLDEGGQMKADVYTVVQARVAIARGQILITTTPYNMGWLYQEVVKPAQNDTEHYTVVNWSSEQNPYFPKEEYERVRRTMDAVTFDMRYRGVFRKRHGLVYPAFDEHALYNDPPKGFNEVIGGIDWGYTVPSAALVVGIDYDRHYWVLAEYYARQKTTAEIIHA
jgi:phage terminase large subunit-like protein